MSVKSESFPPSKNVLSMFGADVEPVLLAGGEGQSYQAGNIVLKPTVDTAQAQWIAETLQSIHEDGFRVIKAVPTIDGQWVCDGWQAFYFIEGETIRGRWEEKIAVSRNFHAQLVGVARPDFIGQRNNPWEIADSVVWNVIDEEYGEKVRPVTDRLTRLKRPLQLAEQIIHGDMTGNILFHDKLPPAIIDFSPYWRPAEYATAIIVVDAIVWEGSDDALFSMMDNTFDNNQLLVRAGLWRIKTTDVFSQIRDSDPTQEIQQYTHFIDVLEKRIAREME